MKAKPVIFDNNAYIQVEPARATHVKLHLPGPVGRIFIKVMIGGTCAGTGNWTWNGDTEKPTLNPSVKTDSGHYIEGQQGKSCWCTYNKDHPDDPSPFKFKCYRDHVWINDGKVQFLADCTHELAGQTLDLIDVT